MFPCPRRSCTTLGCTPPCSARVVHPRNWLVGDRHANATDFEVGRPAGLLRGTDIDHVIPLSIAPGMPLIPGQIYQWRLQIDGDEKAVRSFHVRRLS
jgi:hypothetical protein